MQGNDVFSPVAEIEVKTRKKFPKWMKEAFEKARSRTPVSPTGTRKIAAILFLDHDQTVGEGLALIGADDLKRLLTLLSYQPLNSEPLSPAPDSPSASAKTEKVKSRSRWPRRKLRN